MDITMLRQLFDMNALKFYNKNCYETLPFLPQSKCVICYPISTKVSIIAVRTQFKRTPSYCDGMGLYVCLYTYLSIYVCVYTYVYVNTDACTYWYVYIRSLHLRYRYIRCAVLLEVSSSPLSQWEANSAIDDIAEKTLKTALNVYASMRYSAIVAL